jgi:hypothetical protein
MVSNGYIIGFAVL